MATGTAELHSPGRPPRGIYSYDVFGAVRARTGTSASVWKFTGEQEDGAAGDTAYYFLRARYLDVNTGRFVSRDPVEFEQRYGYAGGNPVLYVDPDGLCRNPFGGGISRSGGRRVADAFDCAGDAGTGAGKAVVRATSHCAQDFNWLPEIGDCGARFTDAVLGVGLVTLGAGGAVVGCAGSIAIIAPVTGGLGGVAGCALSAFAGATVAGGGIVLAWNAFQPHGDHTSPEGHIPPADSLPVSFYGGKE